MTKLGRSPRTSLPLPRCPECGSGRAKNGKDFDAGFVKRDGAEVTLRGTDGKEFSVKMGGLSDGDRKYVKQLTRAEPAGTPEVAAPAAPADTSVSEVLTSPLRILASNASGYGLTSSRTPSSAALLTATPPPRYRPLSKACPTTNFPALSVLSAHQKQD